jgi:hypothetical protein
MSQTDGHEMKDWIGQQVRVQGLQQSAQYNGQTGRVVSTLPNGRLSVKLDAGSCLSLKPGSLVKIGSAAPDKALEGTGTKGPCALPGCANAASLRCIRCKRAAYCSRACAKEHWPEHKKVCAAADSDFAAYPQEELMKVHPQEDSPAASDFFLFKRADRMRPRHGNGSPHLPLILKLDRTATDPRLTVSAHAVCCQKDVLR